MKSITARTNSNYMRFVVAMTLIFTTAISSYAQWLGTNPVYFNSGNVGIGTSSPTTRFEIIKPSTNNYSFAYRDALPGNDSYLYHSFSTNFHLIGSSWNGTGVQRKIGFAVGNTDSEADIKMSIDKSGNVGIGTVSPGSKLDVHVGTTSTITTALSAYRNGDPNFGIKLLTGIGDGASYATWNGGIGSWQGIGFYSMQDGTTRGVFNVRDGSFSLKGSINSEANANFKGNAQFGTDGGGISLISGPAFSGAIQIKTHSGLGGSANRYLRLGVKDNNSVFYPVLSINDNQFVGIGTLNPDTKLAVKGIIHAEEVRVDLNVPTPDYVFEKNYNLLTLAEVENYINQNKHLPEVPAGKEMEANGVNLGEMNMLLLKKVEELTLYIIDQNRKSEKTDRELKELKTELEIIKSKLK